MRCSQLRQTSPLGPSFEPWRQGSKWIKWWWNVWWNVYTLGHLVAVMAVMAVIPLAASFLLLPPRILVKWPFQLQLLDTWNAELKCLDSSSDWPDMARSCQTKVPIFYHILDISETFLKQQNISHTQKNVLSMSKVAWFALFPHVPHSPFVSIDWQCSSRLSACWATAARSVKPGRTQPNVVRPASSEMCSIDRSIISFNNLHIITYIYTFNLHHVYLSKNSELWHFTAESGKKTVWIKGRDHQLGSLSALETVSPCPNPNFVAAACDEFIFENMEIVFNLQD